MNQSPAPIAWTCPSCRHENSLLEYCPACGERHLHPHQLTLTGLAEQAVESLSHVDGRIARTMRTLLLKPGRLTEAWIRGERRGWMGPFQLFLFLNIVFFFSQSLSGLSVLSAPLHDLTPSAQHMVDAHLAKHGGTQAELKPVFDRQQTTNAKLLVLIMVPLFAVALVILFPLRPRLAAIHLVFALHFYALMLACLSVLFPLLGLILTMVPHRAPYTDPGLLDDVVSSIELALILLYLWPAVGRVYLTGPARRLVTVIALAATVLPILQLYRQFLFWITLQEI